jgi:acetylornithine deacetylase/succinyl-diaminopimelate desuccinylase-like protein
VDNASGVAAITEVARRLAHGPAMERDVYVVATTAEEQGLLGAQAFADNPPIPLTQIVAAFNLDPIAIAPAGSPVGVVGQGLTRLDSGIAVVAREQHRKLVEDGPNAYLKRQDGWALIAHDVPAVMASSAYGDMGRLKHYFDTDYHRPGDVVKPGLELGGAAEDVAFHVALVHYFADPRRWSAGTPGPER